MDPTTLVLENKTVFCQKTRRILYSTSQDVTCLKPNISSMKFERAICTPDKSCEPDIQQDDDDDDDDDDDTEAEHIFYLAHPIDARYRKDIPDYYATSASSDTVGNMYFETSKPTFQRTEFQVFVSPGRSASSRPLFEEEEGQQMLLFTAKTRWTGGGYRWVDSEGKEVGVEDGKGGENRLVVTASMERGLRDALVAMWVVRLWYERAESRQARREELERLTPAMPYGSDITMAKRMGALGAFAGGAGA